MRRPPPWEPVERCGVLLGYRRPCRFNLGLNRIEVEAGTLLHWRELHRGHRKLLNLLLDKYEAPEFILEPIEVLLRSELGPAIGPAHSLEWIEAQVDQVGHVRLGFITQPTSRLVDEAILVVVDTAGASFTPSPVIATICLFA